MRYIYKKVNYDILTFVGDVGGLIDFVLLMGWAFTTALASRMHDAEMVRDAYRWQRYHEDSTPYYQTL